MDRKLMSTSWRNVIALVARCAGTSRLDVTRCSHSRRNAQPGQEPPHDKHVGDKQNDDDNPFGHGYLLCGFLDHGYNVSLDFPRHFIDRGGTEGCHHCCG